MKEVTFQPNTFKEYFIETIEIIKTRVVAGVDLKSETVTERRM